ncbi:ogr/Delta-like zinc finger family protein [Ralstonia pseudosolanacearum]|uniref:Zinc finger Ogr/Delta-type domain-containing protein n=1 Tax=Ralstonia phage RSY1 TaxID=1530085 RepID=A0A077K829_9CAUD|nr:ogr/Delta-like zinc finger family protein [Ralstonia pseudosolanacearum]YP_009067117.1 transcriptional regulator [Ralstonia phage RSY1]APC68773.1 transcriptional regulator [Ralstonia solanacearum OE1-1]OIN71785.1 transcriptional regulator [Ralstonia solanacearum]API74499.1 transcriptional regulator [Ralstonia pseudosolanacearum]QKL92063.1 ogr/Delta-like zinc finger family protein [Ralstonia solanacearum]QKL97138.1 ogr/Delta-like zinc finger family protein [Ralstonia solanacearum]
MKMKCPHCDARMHIRTSRAVSLLSRELYLQCPNVECAYTCVAILSAVRTIAPSMRPNPKAYLPVGRTRLLPQNPCQLDLLPG